jgi:alpha-tubulin suppressor-like RCC1 family protein
VSSSSASGSQVTVNLTEVTNAQRITITLVGVNDGASSNDVIVPMVVLAGDTNADSRVNVGDVNQTASRSGQLTSSTNFRCDVNLTGNINVGDRLFVQSKSGTLVALIAPKPDKLASGNSSVSILLQSDGTLWSWGPKPGDGTPWPRSYPLPLGAPSNAISASAGDSHAALLTSNGVVWSWGKNENGQLGDGTVDDRDLPVANLSNVISVKAGGFHTLVLLQDGTVAAWGKNNNGQLGDDETMDSAQPVMVSNLAGVTQIAGGYERSLALKTDGTVWRWGFEAGYPNVPQPTYITTPIQISGLTSVTAIAAGLAHSVAVKSDGTVRSWGNNSNGELGNGSTNYSATPIQVSNISTAVSASTSYDHTLVLLADGTIKAWGSNNFGQLGNGTTSFTNVPVQVSGLTNVIATIAAQSYSMALKSDGTVWAWGKAGSALGLPSSGNALSPQQVTLGLLDQNSNNMDDRWEMQYFGNLNQTVSGDFDSDGLRNGEEAYLDTNPIRNQPAPPRFAIVDLMTSSNSSGSSEAYASSLNNLGQVALFLDSLPARWTSGVIEQLDLGNEVRDLEALEAFEISDSGAVVGTAFGEPTSESGNPVPHNQPAVWLPGSTAPVFLPLPNIPQLGGINWGVGLKIVTTATGELIFGKTVNRALDTYGRPRTASMVHRWDGINSAAVLLPGQDGRFQDSMHLADVNSSGVLIGIDGDGQPFVGGGTFPRQPTAINSIGHIIGNGGGPFFWDGRFTTLPGATYVADMNDSDDVVGYANNAPTIWRWDPETSAFVGYDLLKWLRVTLGPDAAPVSLTGVSAINNNRAALASVVMPTELNDKPRLLLPVDVEKASIRAGEFIVMIPDINSGATGIVDLLLKRQGSSTEQIVWKTFSNQLPGRITITLDDIMDRDPSPLDSQDAKRFDRVAIRWRTGNIDVTSGNRNLDVYAVEVLTRRKISNYFSPTWGGTWAGNSLQKGVYAAGTFPTGLINVSRQTEFLNALDPLNEGLAMDGNTVIRDQIQPAQPGFNQVVYLNGTDRGYIEKPDRDQDNASSPSVQLLRPTSVAVRTNGDRLRYNDEVYVPEFAVRTVDDSGTLGGNTDQIDVWRGQGDQTLQNIVDNFGIRRRTCLKIIVP